MAQSTKQLSVLYAEDDNTMRKNTADTLRLFFDTVHEASNGAEALSIFNEKKVHILITDYAMSVMNGHDLAVAIRKEEPKIPIIFTSSYTDKTKLLSCMPLKLIDYLEKPFSFDALSHSIATSVKELVDSGALTVKIKDDTTYCTMQKALLTNEDTMPLSKNESDLLELFIKRRGQVVSGELIASVLYGGGEVFEENAIKNAVYRLRKKLPKDAIHNIKNIGYLFN